MKHPSLHYLPWIFPFFQSLFNQDHTAGRVMHGNFVSHLYENFFPHSPQRPEYVVPFKSAVFSAMHWSEGQCISPIRLCSWLSAAGHSSSPISVLDRFFIPETMVFSALCESPYAYILKGWWRENSPVCGTSTNNMSGVLPASSSALKSFCKHVDLVHYVNSFFALCRRAFHLSLSSLILSTPLLEAASISTMSIKLPSFYCLAVFTHRRASPSAVQFYTLCQKPAALVLLVPLVLQKR